MCGIAGFIFLDKPDFDENVLLQNMTDSLIHRGPDDWGIKLYKGDDKFPMLGFGHRRLSILDLSKNAQQPFFDSEKRVMLIFNGEIYNYLELKKELIQKGHRFITTSDTEVLLNAYIEWGTNCFSKFNGMWSCAIFDKSKNSVILSRDRLGKKPLYYYLKNGVFVFASEIKAILKCSKVPKELNYKKIFRYISMNYRYVDIDEECFFKDIKLIPTASFVEIDKNLNWNCTKYWSLNHNIHNDISDQDAINTFRDLFIDSVKIRLRSDVPVSCLLSGGMDSTSIAAVSYKVLDTHIETFSGITGKEKKIYDESEYINELIAANNVKSNYVTMKPRDLFDTAKEMIEYYDEPVCTVSWYSLYLIVQSIHDKGIKVVLNGHGGDELLGGYWDHYHYNFNDLFEKGNINGLFNEIESWKDNHGRDPQEIDRSIKYISQLKKNRDIELSKFTNYANLFNSEFADTYGHSIIPCVSYSSELDRRLRMELLYEVTPIMVKSEDRNTMSRSIESRSPFLDYRLVDFCFSLPNRMKIRDGIGKWLLREAMKDILPDKIRLRKDKAGLIAPADRWFRTINKEQIINLLESESIIKRKIFDKEKLYLMFNDHLNGTNNHQMVLWQLINLELWLQKYFD